MKIFLFLGLTAFLAFNLIYSQNISPFYLSVVNEEKTAIVNYLKTIRTLPDFKSQILEYQKIYGKNIKDEALLEDRQKDQMIKELRALLNYNPNNRDILYSLYLIYKNQDNAQAQTYLNKAKAIDPLVEKNY